MCSVIAPEELLVPGVPDPDRLVLAGRREDREDWVRREAPQLARGRVPWQPHHPKKGHKKDLVNERKGKG